MGIRARATKTVIKRYFWEGLKLNRNMFWNVIDSVNAEGPYSEQESQRCRLTAALFPRICARSRTLPGRELVRRIT